jgi:hypothetical protein
MSVNLMSDEYQQNAFHCVRLAHAYNHSESKLVLLMMARGWMTMKEMSFRSSAAEQTPEPNLEAATH